jgi:hypothetical protein
MFDALTTVTSIGDTAKIGSALSDVVRAKSKFRAASRVISSA